MTFCVCDGANHQLRLMQELADQEDLIMEMERRYKGLVAANHLGGVLHGWDGGTLTQKKSLECLPKELRKFRMFALSRYS